MASRRSLLFTTLLVLTLVFPHVHSLAKQYKVEITVNRGCGAQYRQGETVRIYFRVNCRSYVVLWWIYDLGRIKLCDGLANPGRWYYLDVPISRDSREGKRVIRIEMYVNYKLVAYNYCEISIVAARERPFPYWPHFKVVDYEWWYEGRYYKLSLPIHTDDYGRYKEKDHSVRSIRDYVKFVVIDRYVKDLAYKLYRLSPTKDEVGLVNFVAAFVQRAICYRWDWSIGYYDYPKYPIETLWEKGTGDCEDSAILTAALLKALGYRVALIILEPKYSRAGHVMVGVAVSSTYGMVNTWHISYGYTDYYLLETTGPGFKLGDLPQINTNNYNWYVCPL